jgi:RNA polymerase sigma-70 factor (ECF subfamily)
MSDDDQIAADRFLGLLRPIERDLEVYCRRLTFDSRDTADAIQNAVLRAFKAFDRYHDDASFRGWMFKILTNEIFALNRKRRRIARHEAQVEAEQLDSLAEFEPGVASADVMISWEVLADALDQEIVAALAALNESERAVLLLRAIGGLRYREISESLEIPLGSVMGHLHRARQKMRDAILRARLPVRGTQTGRRTAT